MALFAIADLTFRYPLAEHDALQDISFAIEPGEFVLLCGKSGCGKSTLLRHFKTVLTPHGQRDGAILFQNEFGCRPHLSPAWHIHSPHGMPALPLQKVLQLQIRDQNLSHHFSKGSGQ